MALFALAWSQDVGIRVLSVEMQLERQEADQEYLGVSTLNKMFPFRVFSLWAQPTIKLHIL